VLKAVARYVVSACSQSQPSGFRKFFVMLAIVLSDQGADDIYEFSERMLPVAAFLIEQVIQDIHKLIVFSFVMRGK
jgi:hypothetical protein